MEKYVARRTNPCIYIVLCLLCLCLVFAGCKGGDGEATSAVQTDPIAEVTTETPVETTGETTEETIGEETDEETSAGSTEEVTTETVAPDTTVAPDPITATVVIHVAEGSLQNIVEVGKALQPSVLENIQFPSDTATLKVSFKGWEYSTVPDGERKPYDLTNPPAVEEIGMHIYPVLEYSYLVSFNAGEGSFPQGTVTEVFVEAGKTVKLCELIAQMPVKAEDKEYTYPLLGFGVDGKLFDPDAEITVDSPVELTASYGKTEIEYTVIAHTKVGLLPDGGQRFVFNGNYKDSEAFVEYYRSYSYKNVAHGDVLYVFKEISVSREGKEWTVELVWNQETARYAVSFDYDDGLAHTVSYVFLNEKVILPQPEMREDNERYYYFVGWRDSNGYLYNGGYELTVNGDVSFRAEYAPGARKVYTVVFNTEVGIFANGDPVVVLTGYYGDPLVPPAAPTAEALTLGEVVYTFAGWDGDVPATFGENTTYTAVYTTPEAVYFIDFYVDGELYLRVPHYAGVKLEAPERPGSTVGKIFSGWQNIPAEMPATDLKLEAWSREAKVIYMLDGEVILSNSATVGSLVTIASPANKPGYAVSGWATTDIALLDGYSFIMPEHDVCFSAVSTPKLYSVTYIVDGVTLYTDSVRYGDIYTVRGIEVKPGFDFTGWKSESSAFDADGGIVVIPDHDIVFKASFTPCTFFVNYYLDGELLYRDEYLYGVEVTLRPDEVQEGCSFFWSSAGVDISAGVFTMPDCNVDVYGAFSAGDNKIVFIVDGVPYGTIYVRAGELVELSLMPTKQGYTFTGWNCDALDVSEGVFVMPEGDIVLRGSFIPNAYDIIFIDMASGEVIGTSYLDYGARFSLGDRVYCVEGKVSSGWVLLSGDVLRDGDNYIMPDSEVVFGIIWEPCLTIMVEGDYWVPYYDHIEYECEKCHFDEQTGTLYICDPSVRIAGSSENITVVFDYPKE